MKTVRTKAFKAGNAVAIRFPNSWGLAPGREFDLTVEDDGSLIMRPVATADHGLDALYGSFSAGFMADGRGDIEQQPRAWSDQPDARSAA